MPNKVLVTGGTGFIGVNLMRSLKERGYDPVDLSRSGSIKIDLINDDLTELDDYDFDYVVHLAAVSSIKSAKGKEGETMELNLDGTKKLLEYFSKKIPKKLIFMSSVTVYKEVDTEITENANSIVDREDNMYSYSKFLAEQECEQRAEMIPTIIFRLANAYGPHQRVGKTPNLIPQIISQGLITSKIEIYNGKFARDFIYVDDVVSAIIAGLESDFAGTLNLGTGKPTKVGDIAKVIGDELGLEVVDLKRKIDAPLELVPNISLIQDKLNWSPKMNLEEGLIRTIEYYKNAK